MRYLLSGVRGVRASLLEFKLAVGLVCLPDTCFASLVLTEIWFLFLEFDAFSKGRFWVSWMWLEKVVAPFDLDSEVYLCLDLTSCVWLKRPICFSCLCRLESLLVLPLLFKVSPGDLWSKSS